MSSKLQSSYLQESDERGASDIGDGHKEREDLGLGVTIHVP